MRGYTFIVTRFWPFLSFLLLTVLLFGQDPKPQQPQQADPPEEDESLAPKEYAFNPLQAAKELKIGDFYSKKKSWKAAGMRYEEAVKWDPNLAEAWLKLGDARDKLNDRKGARDAWAKYLEVAPDAKNAPEIRKRLKTPN
jgi:tetratricopeptide (TPR) repeat protein